MKPFQRFAVGLAALWVVVVAAGAAEQSSTTPASLEAAVLAAVNQERQAHGRAPLVTNDWLAAEARKHSQAMATGRVTFGHDGFQGRFVAAQKAIGAVGFGENVAYDYSHKPNVVAEVVRNWMASPVHRKNILGDYIVTGIGIHPGEGGKIYFTQLFARQRTEADSAPAIPRGSPFPRKGL